MVSYNNHNNPIMVLKTIIYIFTWKFNTFLHTNLFVCYTFMVKTFDEHVTWSGTSITFYGYHGEIYLPTIMVIFAWLVRQIYSFGVNIVKYTIVKSPLSGRSKENFFILCLRWKPGRPHNWKQNNFTVTFNSNLYL